MNTDTPRAGTLRGHEDGPVSKVGQILEVDAEAGEYRILVSTIQEGAGCVMTRTHQQTATFGLSDIEEQLPLLIGYISKVGPRFAPAWGSRCEAHLHGVGGIPALGSPASVILREALASAELDGETIDVGPVTVGTWPEPEPAPPARTPSQPRRRAREVRTVSLRLEPDLYEQLESAAAERDLPMSFLVAKALRDFLPRLLPVEDMLIVRPRDDHDTRAPSDTDQAPTTQETP